MRLRRLPPFLAVFVLVIACSSRETGTPRSRAGGSGTDSLVPPATTTWFEGVAPMLLAPAHSNDRALVVLADSQATDPEDGPVNDDVTLMKLDGSSTQVRASFSTGSEGCVDAALQPPPAAGWVVGFVGKGPEGIPVDSMRAISRQDSLATAPVIFRLASGIPNAPGGRFAGLPFTLVDLWRIRRIDGSVIIVATTKRQINQEDSPLEERSLVIAEADSGKPLALVHSSRATGPEETVEGNELLAAVRFPGAADLQLIFAHDFGNETSYSVIERNRDRSWTVRWSSRRFSC